MSQGEVLEIFVSQYAGERMQRVKTAEAERGRGLKGDRYAEGAGSWNKGEIGKRQVTLINSIFFHHSGFRYEHSRRNIITHNIELMTLIGQEFRIGEALFRGVEYCKPCEKPGTNFENMFQDRGGLIAEVLESGLISVRSRITA